MPRNVAAPLGAGMVKVGKGEARLIEEGRKRAPAEPRIGITIRLPESVHEQLRVLAFEQRPASRR